MSNNRNYLQLLDDVLFLEWKFSSSKELDAYWKHQMEMYPELVDEINKADRILREQNFRKNKLAPSEKEILKQKILVSKQNITASKSKRIFPIRWIQYAAAVLALTGIALMLTMMLRQTKPVESENQNLIVGNIGKETDIQVIIGEHLMTYNQNIDIEVDESGNVSVGDALIGESQKDKKQKPLNKIIVPFGKRSKIKLSDNTTVWLNSGTTVEFPPIFDGPTREIFLSKGECFLEVAKDAERPFFVTTNKMRIKVHGTSFNVSAYDDVQQNVILLNGVVSIETQLSEPVFLKPSEKAMLNDNNLIEKMEVDASVYTSWRDGYLILDRTPIIDVLKQIARYYNISFDSSNFENFKDIRCKGKLILSDRLENVLQSISILSSTSYSIEDDIIYITNNR